MPYFKVPVKPEHAFSELAKCKNMDHRVRWTIRLLLLQFFRPDETSADNADAELFKLYSHGPTEPIEIVVREEGDSLSLKACGSEDKHGCSDQAVIDSGFVITDNAHKIIKFDDPQTIRKPVSVPCGN
jgi:hypothetical protein